MEDTIHADALAQALERHGQGIDVLSLDCFDTLLWRTTPEPTDVFCELAPPVTRHTRMVAEKTARERRLVTDACGEVELGDIYRCALPGADEGEIERRVAAEIEAEHRHCVAFRPAVALIRAARERGLRVVVVSDTYLNTDQLRELLCAKIGSETVAMIERIFCSSAFGVSKSRGLFGRVLSALGVPPQRVLHVGDNAKADVVPARELGMRPLHLQQGDEALAEQWRLELAALLTADDRLRASGVPMLPHRPLLAEKTRAVGGDGERLGYATLGPLMYGFARWVREQRDALAAGGRRVKVCFLMRDGHLPLRAYQVIAPDDANAFALEISRFVAYAATLREPADALAYLGLMSDSVRLDALARQLLFTPQETAALVARSKGRRDPVHRLAKDVLRPANFAKVRARSAEVRERLFRYLRATIDPQPGEVLLLVDIGAAGTVQNRVQDTIAEAFGVQLEGRYLLLRDVPRATDGKRGFLGPDRFDGRLLESLYNAIAVVEQLCTVAQGSVVGYDDHGVPQRNSAEFSPQQVAERDRVQSACLRFVADAQSAARSEAGHSTRAQWHGAVAALVRLLLLPMRGEADFFRRFVHDMNLGLKETVPMVDPVAAGQDLRRIGPVYAVSSPRVFVAAELRSHGLELMLQQLLQRRFEIDLRPHDFRRDAVALPVMVMRGQQAGLVSIEALPTHDGYLAASIPIGLLEYTVGVLFGRLFQWLQIESVRVVAAKRQLLAAYREQEVELLEQAVLEGCRWEAPGLLRCVDEQSFVYFAPPAAPVQEAHVLRVVFRPLAARGGSSTTSAPVAAGAAVDG
jgi:FMN phosphatase YigB (HAD superfamily)